VAQKNMDVVVRFISVRFLITGIVAIGMLTIGMLVYSQWLTSGSFDSRSFRRNASLIRLTQTVQQEGTTAYPRTGEALAGDQRKIIAINTGILIILTTLLSAMAILVAWSRRLMDASAIAIERLVQQRTAEFVAREAEAEQRNRDLALAMDQLRAASQIKSQFLANICHEIRTPMNGVTGMASLLLHTDLTQAQKEYVDTLHSLGLSLLAIINDVLDFKKIEAGKITLDIAEHSQRPIISRRWSSINKKILVVDDNEVNLLVAGRMLEELGFEVDLAASGREAIDAAAVEDDYAAIFIDCQMPGMDGNEATRIIRLSEGDEQHTPIIALTTNTMVLDREKAFAAGVDDYLCKPVFLEDIEMVLDRLLSDNIAQSGWLTATSIHVDS